MEDPKKIMMDASNLIYRLHFLEQVGSGDNDEWNEKAEMSKEAKMICRRLTILEASLRKLLTELADPYARRVST